MADLGSCWAKTLETDTGSYRLEETRKLVQSSSLIFDVATGHMAKERAQRYKNEILALAHGALRLVDEDNFAVVDVGARDIKYCRFVGRRSRGLDWNQSCGAAVGFTLELLGRYYNIDFAELPVAEKRISLTCGVFGIERIFDSIIKGSPVEEAVSRFVHGLAYNVFTFVQRPKKIYLSGGLCENRCFVKSLSLYCDVAPLGRHVLLAGLQDDE